MKNENHRSHFRLNYSPEYHPTLIMDKEHYTIENVSEYGVKVHTGEDLTFMQYDTILAVVSFSDGHEYGLGGQVVRIDNESICLHFDAPLPKSVIRSEMINAMYNYRYH